LAKIQGNHQNWWQFCRKSMWAPIWTYSQSLTTFS
jgi:hypothetical protein